MTNIDEVCDRQRDCISQMKDSKIASLKRTIAALRQELKAWRKTYPNQFYKPDINDIVVNDPIASSAWEA